MESIAELVAATKSQLGGDLANLQKLWLSVRSAKAAIQRATIAYTESRSLLERIDGVRGTPVLSEIPMPNPSS